MAVDIRAERAGVAEIVVFRGHAGQIGAEVRVVLGCDGLPVGKLVAHGKGDPRGIRIRVDAGLRREADKDARRAGLAEQPPRSQRLYWPESVRERIILLRKRRVAAGGLLCKLGKRRIDGQIFCVTLDLFDVFVCLRGIIGRCGDELLLGVFAHVEPERLVDRRAEVPEAPDGNEQEHARAEPQQNAGQPAKQAPAPREHADERIEKPQRQQDCQHLPQRDGHQPGHGGNGRQDASGEGGVERKDHTGRGLCKRDHQARQDQKDRR